MPWEGEVTSSLRLFFGRFKTYLVVLLLCAGESTLCSFRAWEVRRPRRENHFLPQGGRKFWGPKFYPIHMNFFF